MNREPDIVLSGRIYQDEERICSLYEYKIRGDIAIFKYRFNDWCDDTTDAYFILYEGVVYYNRDIPVLNMGDYVENYHRDHAYSNKEIKAAIENYLIEKALLETYA
jgi:hypothetical protein